MSRRPMNQNNDNELITLIKSYAWKWLYILQQQGIHVDYDEVFSEVAYAVCNCKKYFDPNRGTKFSSYAIEAVKHKLGDFRHKAIQYQTHFVSLQTLAEHNPDQRSYRENR